MMDITKISVRLSLQNPYNSDIRAGVAANEFFVLDEEYLKYTSWFYRVGGGQTTLAQALEMFNELRVMTILEGAVVKSIALLEKVTSHYNDIMYVLRRFICRASSVLIFLLKNLRRTREEVAERSKAADCKSVGNTHVGSNPIFLNLEKIVTI